MPTEHAERRPWHEFNVLKACARITHNDLADTLGIHPTYLSHYARGERTPNPLVVVQIAQALRVPVDALTPGAVETDGFRACAERVAANAAQRYSNGYASKLIADVTSAAA